MATIAEYLRAHGLHEAALEVEDLYRLRDAAQKVVHATYSHCDGRDLLAELHPRSEIDIHRRRDGVVKVFEGDWLTRVYDAMKDLRVHVFHAPKRRARLMDGRGPIAQAGVTRMGGDAEGGSGERSELARDGEADAPLLPSFFTDETTNDR